MESDAKINIKVDDILNWWLLDEPEENREHLFNLCASVGKKSIDAFHCITREGEAERRLAGVVKELGESTVQQIIATHKPFEQDLTNVTTQLELVVDRLLSSSQNSSVKGKLFESLLEEKLFKAFPDAKVNNTAGQAYSGDISIVISVLSKDIGILIDNKSYTRPVPTSSVVKLKRDLKLSPFNYAIMASQGAYITGYKRFELEDNIIFLPNITADSDAIIWAIFCIIQIESQQIGQQLTVEDSDVKKLNQSKKILTKLLKIIRQKRTNISKTLEKAQKQMEESIKTFKLCTEQLKELDTNIVTVLDINEELSEL